jgi:hypothetical protein
VLLTGWKEIAAYLRFGIRTVQGWERLGLPVIRVGSVNGVVMAHSERLDTWVDNRGFRRLRSDVAVNIGRARALQERVVKQLQASLKTELAVGLTQARIALRSGNPKDVSRHTAIARESYDTIIHLSHRMARKDVKSKQFTAELDELKDALRELGENI